MDMTKRRLRQDEQRFINEIASLLMPWGLAPSSGRVYGYLMLCQTPASVDQIATALEMSRAGAWSAARALEAFGHINRHGAPGSKLALFASSDNFAAPLSKQTALLGNIATVLQTCAAETASGAAAARLKQRARFYLALRQAMDSTMQELTAQQARKRA
jgi:hypothetical protein